MRVCEFVFQFQFLYVILLGLQIGNLFLLPFPYEYKSSL